MLASDGARRLLLAVARVVPHTDADGLAAGAIALRARGEPAAAAVLLGRGETPFGARPPLPAGSVAVVDGGVRPLERTGVRVDHHAPEAEPRADQLVVSGYGERPSSYSLETRSLADQSPRSLEQLRKWVGPRARTHPTPCSARSAGHSAARRTKAQCAPRRGGGGGAAARGRQARAVSGTRTSP